MFKVFPEFRSQLDKCGPNSLRMEWHQTLSLPRRRTVRLRTQDRNRSTGTFAGGRLLFRYDVGYPRAQLASHSPFISPELAPCAS